MARKMRMKIKITLGTKAVKYEIGENDVLATNPNSWGESVTKVTYEKETGRLLRVIPEEEGDKTDG